MIKASPNIGLVPVFNLVISVVAAFILLVLIVGYSMDQRWLGLRLHANLDQNKLELLSASYKGPAIGLPYIGTLKAIASPTGEAIDLSAEDKVDDPDMLENKAEIAEFFVRQTQISNLMQQPELTIHLGRQNGEVYSFKIQPQNRSFFDMSFAFRVKLLVAVGSLFLSIWVFLIRRNFTSAEFALAGIGLAMAAGSAAIYGSRELAMNGEAFEFLWRVNHFGGTFLFCFGLVAVFLNYPRKLVSRKYLLVFFVFSFGWQMADQFGAFNSVFWGNYLWAAMQMGIISILMSVQYIASKNDPRNRSALMWFGLSVSVGARIFVLTNIIPVIFGLDAINPRSYAYMLFFTIYIGTALSVVRFRLFELDDWVFKTMFYMGGSAILIDLGAILYLVLSIDVWTSLFFAIFWLSTLYLPFAGAMARRLMPHRNGNEPEIFNDVMDIAYAATPRQQKASWLALIQRIYQPIDAEFTTQKTELTNIALEGLELHIAAVKTLPSIRLAYAHGGKKLFSTHDVVRARELVGMIEHAIDNRYAHEKGVSEERQRIARDMHDNIGAQLLSALHSKKMERKNVMIRETITDLRDVINNASSQDLSFNEILADLRVETAERLATVSINLDWAFKADETPPLKSQTIHALRSIIREVVSNCIKHANAKNFYLTWDWADDMVILHLRDDGKGVDENEASTRTGIANIEARITSLNGMFLQLPNDPGASFEIKFPTDEGRAK